MSTSEPKIRILYIENADREREELEGALRSRHFHVRSEKYGKKGLEALGAGGFEVLLCDLHMPEMSGMDVLERVKISTPDLPVIFLTGHPSVPEAVEAVRRGAYRFMAKPVNIDELEITVHQSVEHARALRWLRSADEQLRLLVETTPIPYIITRLSDGRILYANQHLASLVGLSPAEMKRRHSTDFYYDPEERNAVVAKLEKEGYLHDYEVRVKKADGTPVWAIFSLARTELGGEPVVLGGIYNITQRKEAEEALLKERNFVSAILDTADALVIVLDPDGRIVRFNRACEKTTGYSSSEVWGHPFWDLFLVDEEQDMVRERFEKIRAGPYPVQGENHWRTKTGELRLIAWSNTALLGPGGELEYVVATGIDITERRKAEQKLRLYREIFMNSIDVIVILDRDGRIIERNPAHALKSGYTDGEVLGRSPTDFFGEQKTADIKEAVARQKSYHGEAVASGKDGTPVWMDLSIFPILDESGEPTCFVGMGRNITEIKMALADLAFANQELRATQAQLVQSEKMASLGSLVAGIAHEINTPVGAIGSMHDTLVRAVDRLVRHLEARFPGEIRNDPELGTAFEVIRNANQVIEKGYTRVAEIVRRLRSFARLDEAELKKVDIHQGLEDTLVLIHHQIKHNITVRKEYGNIPPMPVYPGRLNQVFLNLLNNARQAIRGKGDITIRTWVEGNKAHVAISDTGVGIPREHLKSIFDPGFTTKGVGVGTGLGLSICYQIVQEHKGEIKVESEVGKGTTFTVVLPANLDKLLGTS